MFFFFDKPFRIQNLIEINVSSKSMLKCLTSTLTPVLIKSFTWGDQSDKAAFCMKEKACTPYKALIDLWNNKTD